MMESRPISAFDLLIRNGHVIDPAQNIDQIADVGIREGRIEQVGPNLSVSGCPDVRDASGTYVCAGLIDLHGHWYEGGLYGINALPRWMPARAAFRISPHFDRRPFRPRNQQANRPTMSRNPFNESVGFQREHHLVH